MIGREISQCETAKAFHSADVDFLHAKSLSCFVLKCFMIKRVLIHYVIVLSFNYLFEFVS